MAASSIHDHGSSHLLELTMAAFRLARESASATAEGLATTSAATLRVVRARELELDSLDRDIDDLVTSTIARVTETEARELLACMKFIISLERIGDLLLCVCIKAAEYVIEDEQVGLQVQSPRKGHALFLSTR